MFEFEIYSSEWPEISRAKFCLVLNPLGKVLLLVSNIISTVAAFCAQEECKKAQVADALKYLVYCVNQSFVFVYLNAKT